MNLGYVFEHGDAVLVGVFLLLIGMSVLSWYVIFWKLWKLHKEETLLVRFKNYYTEKADWPLHFRETAKVKGCVASILNKTDSVLPTLSGYSKTDRRSLLTMHLVQSLDHIRVWLDKGLTVLASIGSSAPFIGLFGTVWGIYGALTDIAIEGDASITVVAGPMGEALVATALGLFAAIPAVLAYNAFLRKNRLLVQDLRHIAEQLTAYLSIESDSPDHGKKSKESANVRLIEGGAR